MKLVFLAVMLLAILPLASWLRSHPGEVPKVWTIFGFLPFVLTLVPHTLFMSIMSWGGWPGYVEGIELSALDLIALTLYLNLPTDRKPIPFRFTFAFYFFAVLLSVFQAGVPMATVLYLWQLARMFLIYALIVRACADERVAPALLKGMAIGLCLQTCIVIWQRFGLGIVQATGSFPHQNSLGMTVYFVIFPFLALTLAGHRGWRPFAIVIASCIVAILTTSRATMGLVAFGCTMVFVLSAWRGWTPRKGYIGFAFAIAVLALSPLVLASLDRRFGDKSIIETHDERANYDSAANMMLSDHPMGVGANNYVVVANTQGYFDRAGVDYSFESRGTSVHNAYWLAAAETGYIGLLAFILLLAQPLFAALRCGLRYRKDRRADILLGLAVALLMVDIHSLFEWIFFSFQNQYFFAIAAGLVGGLARQLGYWGTNRAHALKLSRP